MSLDPREPRANAFNAESGRGDFNPPYCPSGMRPSEYHAAMAARGFVPGGKIVVVGRSGRRIECVVVGPHPFLSGWEFRDGRYVGDGTVRSEAVEVDDYVGDVLREERELDEVLRESAARRLARQHGGG